MKGDYGPHAGHLASRAPAQSAAGRQRGAALLMAMLTVTLVASLAAAAMWQQWRSVEIEAAERSRMQSAWVLIGAIDWARLILRDDARAGGADHLAEPWAVPLQETRLSTFLAADRNNTGGTNTDMGSSSEGQNAFLSGQITDLQSRLNVLNLVEGDKVSEIHLKTFARLFELLGLPPQQLALLANAMVQAFDAPGGNPAAPLLPQQIEQLVWLGVAPQTLAVLRPYITMLPARTPVNLNTASAEVISASLPTLDLAEARRLVAARDITPFRSLADAGKLAGAAAVGLNEGQHSVVTHYFEVRRRLRLDQTTVEERSLVQREELDVRTLWRERGAASAER